MTLKSRSRVTQGHWKRNHWIDHTRLTISRVIWRWILLWPWNVVRDHSRSLKLVPFETLGAVSYSPSIVTMAVSVAVCELFSVKACDLGNWVRGHSRSFKMARLLRRTVSHIKRGLYVTSALSRHITSVPSGLYMMPLKTYLRQCLHFKLYQMQTVSLKASFAAKAQ